MSWRYFTRDEFVCAETGENEIDDEHIDRLDIVRGACGFPFHINSGYRSPRHSIEAAKPKPGMHSTGKASDVRATTAAQRFQIVSEALAAGFTGIGIAQTYVHLDLRDTTPVIWLY